MIPKLKAHVPLQRLATEARELRGVTPVPADQAGNVLKAAGAGPRHANRNRDRAARRSAVRAARGRERARRQPLAAAHRADVPAGRAARRCRRQ